MGIFFWFNKSNIGKACFIKDLFKFVHFHFISL
jgi:hypothetical protein